MTAEINIRALKGEELEEGQLLLAESFMEDPTIEWMLQKNSVGFKERVKTYMGLAHQFYIDVKMPIIGAIVNNDLRGVLYGGCIDNMNLQEADSHFNEQIKNALSVEVVERILDYEQSVHDEVLPNTYWLGLIAVAKNARGRGIGSALIKNVIHQCKEDSTIEQIMLDTANIRNIDLYERLGFKSTVVKAFDENFLQTVMAYSLRQ